MANRHPLPIPENHHSFAVAFSHSSSSGRMYKLTCRFCNLVKLMPAKRVLSTQPCGCALSPFEVRSNHRKPRVLLTVNGVSASIKEWAKMAGVREVVIRQRFAAYQSGRSYHTHAEVVYGKRRALTEGLVVQSPELMYRQVIRQHLPDIVQFVMQDLHTIVEARLEDVLDKKFGKYLQRAITDRPASNSPTPSAPSAPTPSAPQLGVDPWWDKYATTWELEPMYGPYNPLPAYLRDIDLDAQHEGLEMPLYVAWHMAMCSLGSPSQSEVEDFLEIRFKDFRRRVAA